MSQLSTCSPRVPPPSRACAEAAALSSTSGAGRPRLPAAEPRNNGSGFFKGDTTAPAGQGTASSQMIAPSPALPPPRQLHSAQIWLSDSDKRCSLPARGADARPPTSGCASPRGPGRGPRPAGIPARRVRRCPRPSAPATPHTFPQLGKVRKGGRAGEGRRSRSAHFPQPGPEAEEPLPPRAPAAAGGRPSPRAWSGLAAPGHPRGEGARVVRSRARNPLPRLPPAPESQGSREASGAPGARPAGPALGVPGRATESRRGAGPRGVRGCVRAHHGGARRPLTGGRGGGGASSPIMAACRAREREKRRRLP